MPTSDRIPGVPLLTPPAKLDHAPRCLAADHGGIVGAVDGIDGDQLRGAVGHGDGEGVGQRVCPVLSACTRRCLLSSV